MNLKILVVTKYKWQSQIKKYNFIKKVLALGGFKNVSISTTYLDVGTPEIINGRISDTWFQKNISSLAKNYNFVFFHFSEKDGLKWGVESGLRGTNFVDSNFLGEGWICSDEHSVIKYKNGTKRERYTKTFLHEIAHELKRQGYTKLEIHNYDFKNEINNLEQFYIDLSKDVLSNLKETVTKLKITLQKTLYPITDLQPLVARNADKVVKEMATLGYPVRVTEGFRSIARQNELYAQGRTTPGNIVTNAKGGESLHNYGVAVDFVFVKLGYDAPDTVWKQLRTVLLKNNFVWGGDWSGFVDKPHAEMTFGRSLSDFQNNK